MSDHLHSQNDEMMIDDSFRGFPSGYKPLTLKEIGQAGWKPYEGAMALPLMSLSEQAFSDNARAMMQFAKANDVEIAPHAKTPMSPDLARRLIAHGAWGVTVADIRQASVFLKNGFRKLILGNQIGGANAVKRLARLMSSYPDAELYVFVDSVAFAEMLIAEWSADDNLPKLGLLVELGVARAGLRDAQSALPVIETILSHETANLRLSGIAAYEGAAGVADPDETIRRVDHLLDEATEAYQMIVTRLQMSRPLILTAGGSLFFDRVVAKWKPLKTTNQNLQIILRSGAIFFHDHGVYERGITQLDNRHGFGSEKAADVFSPALRLWAEVLSRPEPQTVICGFGMRDVAFDQDLPRILNIYRDGRFLRALTDSRVLKLNDQHAFIECAANADIKIGDVVELGISHPCTCIDRHSLIYGLDDNQTVVCVYPTHFG